ncbi:MAG: DDE-type integrase/transposase/recombinase [Caulobacteraceae bacterium]
MTISSSAAVRSIKAGGCCQPEISCEVLESYVTKTRDKAAALKFISKAMKRHVSAKAIVTAGLRSYKAALKEIGNADHQEVDRWANYRAGNSHLPFRRRERAMNCFRRIETRRKFSPVHAQVHILFRPERQILLKSPCLLFFVFEAHAKLGPIAFNLPVVAQ